VYDLLSNRRTVKINAHQDDVNSCCWADTASGNVLISASDDTFLKVWCVPHLASSMTLSKEMGLGTAARWVLRRSLQVY
jgi:DDB1- and CUL4-associated factor 11